MRLLHLGDHTRMMCIASKKSRVPLDPIENISINYPMDFNKNNGFDKYNGASRTIMVKIDKKQTTNYANIYKF